MTMFARFTPHSKRLVVRGGTLAGESGRQLLDTDFLLLAVAESGVVDGVSAAAVRARIGGPTDHELLATLGIDLDVVRSRVGDLTDDLTRWDLKRSPTRPLRVTLTGPAGDLRLTGQARKVIEVAQCWARHRDAQVSAHDLMAGLLADDHNESVRILRHLGTDLRALWRRGLPGAAA